LRLEVVRLEEERSGRAEALVGCLRLRPHLLKPQA
jgi:hypothetical protein